MSLLVRINNDKIEYMTPGTGKIEVNNFTIFNPTEKDLFDAGFEYPPLIDCPEDCHLEYKIENNEIVAFAVKDYVEPIKFSKLKLVLACKKRNAWADIKAYIVELDMWDEFELAQELSNDYPGFDQIITIFKEKFPELNIDQILEESEL